MCGIAGAAWNSTDQRLERSTLERMTNVLTHRGPDDCGFYVSTDASNGAAAGAGCALGHRRLSIIDLSGGHQPLSNEDGTIWVAFNGEIYNYRELREQLREQGHQFATATDTEVLVHLYEQHGTDCVRFLRGMFVFAVWDQRHQRLLLVRDRLGQKPLFYRLSDGQLLFASELKALLQVPGVSKVLNLEAVDQFLTYQYVPYPNSILQGVHKLPPAHLALFEDGQLTVTRYWEPDFQRTGENVIDWPVERWQRELREALTEAVRLRMRSDVPIGAFLSGGMDSTIISGLMQQLSPHPIHTFSIGFPVREYDERKYAREAAAHLGTEHHEYIVEPAALEALPRLIWHYDEPFGDSSAIPTMALSEVTRQVVKVALSGDGGDELFAGYNRYQAVYLAGRTDRLPSAVKRLLSWNLWQRIPTSTRQRALGRRAKRFAAALAQSPEERYLRWIGIFDADARDRLYSADFKRRLGNFQSSQFILNAYAQCPDRDFVTRTTCVDVLTYLPCDILTKVDIASMSYGLEARSPFLDHNVVDLAARMPIELKFQPGRGKKILAETFADLLPASIQTRSKMGFGVPIDHWFRNELSGLIRETLLSEQALDRGLFRPEAVQQLIDEHVSGRWDHAYRLWNLLCLECWQRMFLDQTAPAKAPVELPC